MPSIDKLAWIRVEGGRILVARSRGKDVYFIPGGKREGGESDAAALIREVREELGVALRPATIHHLRTFEAQAHDRPEGVSVRMTCFTADYDGEIQASAEIEEVAWLAHADRHRLSLVAQIIADWLHSERMLI